jgi:hypothetical protein
LGDPLKGNLLLFYKPLHLEAQQVSTRIEVRRHQPAPWLVSKDDAYAVFINWSAESKDDFVAGGLDEKGKLAKLNTMPIEDDVSRDINSIRRNMETDTFDLKYRM